MDASSEYVDITIDGQNVGTCTPNICQGCCTLHDCVISPSQITSSSSGIKVSLQYSIAVQGSVATCPIDGQNWAAAALITLTGGKYCGNVLTRINGNIFYFFVNLNN